MAVWGLRTPNLITEVRKVREQEIHACSSYLRGRKKLHCNINNDFIHIWTGGFPLERLEITKLHAHGLEYYRANYGDIWTTQLSF